MSSVNPGGNKSCTDEGGGGGWGQVTASFIWHCGMLYIGWLFVHEHSVVLFPHAGRILLSFCVCVTVSAQ